MTTPDLPRTHVIAVSFGRAGAAPVRPTPAAPAPPLGAAVQFIDALLAAADAVAAQRAVPLVGADLEQTALDAVRGHPRLNPCAWTTFRTAIRMAAIADDWRGRWPWLAVIAALRDLLTRDLGVLRLELAAVHGVAS